MLRTVIISLCTAVFYLGIATTVFSNTNYMATSGEGKGDSEFDAIIHAYGNMVNSVLLKMAGDSASSRGVAGKEFNKKLLEDPEPFIDRFFQDESYTCWMKSVNETICSVEATAKLFEFRPAIARIQTTGIHGSDRIGKVKMAILRNPKNRLSVRLADSLKQKLDKFGHNVELLTMVPVGKAGNSCDDIQRQLRALKKKGSYPKAEAQLRGLLKTCEKNKDIARKIVIRSPEIETTPYNNRNQSIKGNLLLDVKIYDSERGKEDISVNDLITTWGYGVGPKDATSDLITKLLHSGADKITANLNESLARKSRIHLNQQSSTAKLEDELSYFYTIQLDGVTQVVAEDRRKARLIRDIIKAKGMKVKLDSQYSERFTTIYRFGSKNEIEAEDFLDELYEAAANSGYLDFRGKIEGERHFVVSFGG